MLRNDLWGGVSQGAMGMPTLPWRKEVKGWEVNRHMRAHTLLYARDRWPATTRFNTIIIQGVACYQKDKREKKRERRKRKGKRVRKREREGGREEQSETEEEERCELLRVQRAFYTSNCVPVSV